MQKRAPVINNQLCAFDNLIEKQTFRVVSVERYTLTRSV